jgi:hypothetical protein
MTMHRKRITGNNQRIRSGRGGSVRLFSCLTLDVLFVLSCCALASREDFVEDISSYDLQQYVPVPVPGALAVTSFKSQNLELKVLWKDSEGEDIDPRHPFEDGELYKAEITLTARPPYEFDPKTSFEYRTARVLELEGYNTDTQIRTLLVSYFPCGSNSSGGGSGLVVNYDLQQYVPVPASSARVVTRLERPDLALDVTWKDSNGRDIPALQSFSDDTVYQAKISLTARGNYKFDPNMPFRYVTAEVEKVEVVDEGSSDPRRSRTLRVQYLPAGSANKLISHIDLTYRILPPAIGNIVERVFFAEGYEGKIEWYIDTSVSKDEVFRPNTKYTASVTLTPKEKYQFGPDVSVAYTNNRGIATEFKKNDKNQLSGSIVFVETEAPTLFRFSGSPNAIDSAIDLIRFAGGQRSLSLTLISGVETEKVQLINTTDLGADGLILIYNPDSLMNPKTTDSPAELVIDGGGKTVDLTESATGNHPLITVGDGVTLTLRNITFKGLKSGDSGDAGNNTVPLIWVEGGGKLIMENGVTISHNSSGGVFVNGGASFFTMNGGTISHNSSHGVSVGSGGAFTMNGGTISHNSSHGVSVGGGGAFTMKGGTISNNNATNDGGGVRNEGTFIMDGGTISGNTAKDEGGGVSLLSGAMFIMEGGIIKENTAQKGGGVSVTHGGGQFSMYKNGHISGNTAELDGGGVYLAVGKFRMYYGTIDGNKVTCKDGNGGGVYVGEAAVFEMDAGSIQSNGINPGGTDKDGKGKGCGVYVVKPGTFLMTGGTIFGIITMNDDEHGGSAWEESTQQNYYSGPAHSTGENEHTNIGETLGGRNRGYAVYYYRGVEEPWRRERTLAGNRVVLNTDDSGEHWNDDYGSKKN